MANAKSRTSWRTLGVMGAVLLALLLGVFSTVQWGGGQWTPKLGLDLEGGTQMVLAPQVGEGVQINEQQLSQAVDIMRARVDSQGVSEAEVATLGNNVVVAVPGEMSKQQEESLRQSSQMRFRPVLAMLPAEPEPAPTATGTPPGKASPTGKATPNGKATAKASTAPKASATPSPTRTANAVAADALQAHPAAPSPAPTPKPDLLRQPKLEEVAPGLTRITPGERNDPQKLIAYATNEAWLQAPSSLEAIQALDCAKQAKPDPTKEDPDMPVAACDLEGKVKYLLGPSVITGDQLADASSGNMTNQQGQPMPGYQVNLKMKPEARDLYRVVSQHMLGLQEPRNQLATVLDGQVVSAPYFSGVIPDGQAAISGNFTAESAQMLADQLKFGALPMSFSVQSSEQISPTVGGDQLRLGLLAGLIGLGLVVVYFLIQYRVLGLVTTASLAIVALVTYLALVLLGWHYNLRLTLAGVTGAIVAIGTTADSFIVYFERVRDEVREGRAVPSAVETGWARARRTIVISGAVNFLAALVLYLLAASNVRGFAFMLMLTTIIDLLVTFCFTHPMLHVLTDTKFFGEGHRWSGLSAESLGVDRTRYLGRGRVGRPGQARGSGGATAAGTVQDAPHIHTATPKGEQA
ncbi:protein translocase subunit SecD [Mobilicoccus pelagius]|uniref:Protein translocase subunit SecD n=1 Tax=Mobilicoccus pelagius NBRC 104925 TaxID=1089455 RepID=H5UPF6_9MICO|nr:protein translocase subunit SecD [Mobilicoccus pelagius]GAB47614.1 protein-export membrane protein SecD [Mobilicoccus pelagius NBRC 104925]